MKNQLIRMSLFTMMMISLAILVAPGSPSRVHVQEAEAPATQTFTLDPVHCMAIFRVQHMGAGQFYGRFNEVAGSFQFDADSEAGPSFDVTIATESVDSAHEGLDRTLKSPNFFNAKEYPSLTFKSTSATKTKDSPETWDVTGDLTMHGVSRTITVPMTMTGMADKGRGIKCGFEGVFEVNRSDYGMMFGVNNGSLGDQVRVIISLEGDLDTEG